MVVYSIFKIQSNSIFKTVLMCFSTWVPESIEKNIALFSRNKNYFIKFLLQIWLPFYKSISHSLNFPCFIDYRSFIAMYWVAYFSNFSLHTACKNLQKYAVIKTCTSMPYFDLMTPGSIHAYGTTACHGTLVLIAQAVFLLEHGQIDKPH